MALPISQIVAASYPAVLAEARKPANQWAESAFLRELERQGMIKHVSLGGTIEVPVDYLINAGADFLATDLEDTGLTKTDVIGGASYAIAQLNVPVIYSKGDDAKNPTENQKIAFVKALLTNAIDSHDEVLETALFTSINGFVGLDTMVTVDGLGTIGGIVAGTDVMWKNKFDTYTDETDMEAGMTSVFYACEKGSGSKTRPSLIVSAAEVLATYEGQLQTQQRFADSKEADGGFKVLAFKSARCVHSQRALSNVGQMWFLGKGSYELVVSKQYFRDKGEVSEIPNAQGYVFKLYSALQAVTGNRSRLGYLSV